jgi:hypothetical protein
MWYIATAVVAVLVIATVSILIATSGESGGGGGGTAGGVDCSDRAPDDAGFSECMRKLAGAVPDNNECTAGANMPGVGSGTSVETPGTTVVTCMLADDYFVQYYHFEPSKDADGNELSGPEVAQKNIDTIFQTINKGKDDAEQAEWSGDGLTGTSYFVDIGLGNGVLLFTADDSPLLGALFKISTGGDESGDDVPGYFNDHIKPGADGGA